MKQILIVSLFLISACVDKPGAPIGSAGVATATAITHVTTIDAINGLRENQTVIFDGDRILRVEPTSELSISAAMTINGTGKFLIPGLWDFHVHLTYEEALVEAMPLLFLSYGITSVRDTGGLLRRVLPVVEKMRAKGAIAPRVFYAGPLLDGDDVVYDGKSRPEIGVRNATPENARKMVADLKAQGVSFIKIYELVAPEVFEALVAAAQSLQLPIDSHVPLSLRASYAGPKVDSIEHLRNIELDCASNADELHQTRLAKLENPENLSGFELRSSLHKLQRLEAIANYDEAICTRTMKTLINTLQVPTLRLNTVTILPPYEREDWASAFSRLPLPVQRDWQEVINRSRENLDSVDPTFGNWSLFLVGRLHDLGVPIGAGTDTPIGLSVPGYSLHSELEMLVSTGLSPLEAIESATMAPARYFSLQDKMGSIDVGKQADMVLLDANPLDNIANTKRILTVISKGEVFSKESLHALIERN